ncbi:MAG: TetR/AcrR family transcriptional regulator [Planctomycetes bacterium]|nr:TetR/AcrR family transcriptional regulator [Planctomycetota bacterium]
MEKINIKSSESLHNKRTREQILCAAEKLFAEKGFSGASIRDITEKADCNIAAVNYHFHGKENLYIEVFHLHMSTIRDLRINAVRGFLSNKSEQKTLEELIHIFATAFLEPFLEESGGPKLMELMMRERYDSHLPQHMFVEEIIQPEGTRTLNLRIDSPTLAHKCLRDNELNGVFECQMRITSS